VAVFQPYKHWHNKAIKNATRYSDGSYGIADFLYNLPRIRDDTFKKNTILNRFRESGLWPVCPENTFKKMKVYLEPAKLPPYLESTSRPAFEPMTFHDSIVDLYKLKPRVNKRGSSPLREVYRKVLKGTINLLN
jgi:hypothetical protein